MRLNLQLVMTWMISDCESPIIFHLSFDIFHLPFERLWFPSSSWSDRMSVHGWYLSNQWQNEKCQMTNGKWFGLLTAYWLPFSVRPTLSTQRQLVRGENSAGAQ